MRRFFKKLLTILFTGFLILNSPNAFAASDDPACHVEEVTPGVQAEVRTITSQPGIQSVKIETSVFPMGGVGRDEGEGELEWTVTDENAISENVALAGEYVAIGYTLNDQRLEVRRIDDGELVFDYSVEEGAGYVDITDDGELIAYAALDSVWLFRPEDEGIPFFRFGMDGYYPGPLKLSSDGEYLVATGSDPDEELNRVWCFHEADPDPVWICEVSANEAFGWYGVNISGWDDVVIVNGKYRLYVLDLETGERIWEAPTYNTESEIAISDDCEFLVVSSLTGILLVYRWIDDGDFYDELWRYRFRAGLSCWVSTCAISADGSTIAAGTLDFYEDHYGGRVAVFETFGRGEPLWIAEPLGDEISDMVLSDDGSIIAASSWGDLEHQTPDLVVHERHNREPFYSLSTPGSMNGVAMTGGGDKVIVGGKGVHSRQFGRGGRTSLITLSILGGSISGRVIDEDDSPLEGAVVSASENPYTAVTDEDGEFRLTVEVDGEREVDVTVHKPGYMHGVREDVSVVENRNTADVNFRLEESDAAPQGVRASQGMQNRILVAWDQYNEDQVFYCISTEMPVKTAIGIETPTFTGLTPWLTKTKPKRDRSDEAESINIYRSLQGMDQYSLIGSADGDDTLFVDDNGVFPQRIYRYVVTADFGNGESEYSEMATGWLDDSFLDWEVDLENDLENVEIDGVIGDDEWAGARIRDISDVFGYDLPDTAGSVDIRIGFNDEDDRLLLGLRYYVVEELMNGMGIGVYVDDDGSGSWSYDRSGSEGNYWGYWIDNAPNMRYRSLSGAPYNRDPYYQFDDPELAFGDGEGFVEIEMAIPLGFHGVEEIGLYHPDYTIGLGLFAMQRDENEYPIFNGWWPQNMFSIVSFPAQFARIHIPAELVVPPVAPSAVELERDDANLILSWMDPELGIDGGELDDLAGINIYRNGEMIEVSQPGAEMYEDNNVSNGGWYEYFPVGFVMDDREPFEGVAGDPVGMYAGEEPDLVEVAYDDGSAEAVYVVAFQGDDNRFAVRYDLDEFDDTVAVYRIDFYTGTTGEMELYIAADVDGVPGDELSQVYLTESKTTGGFHSFHFPGIDQPVVIAAEEWFHSCWVVLNYLPESPGGPSIGVDYTNADGTRNQYYRSEQGWRQFDAGQLMVRIAIGTPVSNSPPEEEVQPVQSFHVYQNFPNPFNGSCIIPITIPDPSQIELEMYDIGGRLIMRDYLGILNPGLRFIPLKVDLLGAGVYLIKLSNGDTHSLIRVSLIK